MKLRRCWNCGVRMDEIRISATERDELLKMWDKAGYLDAYQVKIVEKRRKIWDDAKKRVADYCSKEIRG